MIVNGPALALPAPFAAVNEYAQLANAVAGVPETSPVFSSMLRNEHVFVRNSNVGAGVPVAVNVCE